MADIESPLIFETAALNINPSPEGLPPNSSPNIVYSEGRESLAMLKRWWNRVNPTVTSGGSATVGTLTYGVTPTEGYKLGQTFTFIVGVANSGAYTINVNGLGAKSVFLGGAPLTGGELVVGAIVEIAYDSTQFQIIGASAGKASVAGYLSLSGGTLTGPLTLTGSPPQVVLASAAGNCNVLFNGVAGTTRAITVQTAGFNRWQVLVNSTAEGGSNSGSDFAITRFADAGTAIDTPLAINRASGQATFNQNASISVATGPNLTLNAPGAPAGRSLLGATAGSLRWQIVMGNATAEGGSNAGSDFSVQRFTDAGGTLTPVPLAITRSTGVATFGAAIVNGPSDRTLKENIAPLADSLDKILSLQGVSFDFIKDETKRRQIGLIAQDVAPIVPEVLQDYLQEGEEPKLAIDYTRLVPLLVEAIKELSAKVVRLEAGLATASQA